MVKQGGKKKPLDVSSRVKGLRILIIDDDPAKLDTLASTLRSLGALVSVGGRGKSGYAQASRVPPDVIISDLISPGEKGWKLVEHVRRHPVLRWTPFLLLKWWEEGKDGNGELLKDKLLERIEEVMTPVYLVRERIQTNRPLGGHVSSIGPVALLRLLVQAGLLGTLTVNDGWSVFEVKIKKNALHAVRREGVAGYCNEGLEAFVQLLLSDSGRWSFRVDKGTLQPTNIDSDLEKILSESSILLADLFKRGVSGESKTVSIRAHLGIIDTAESALSVTAQRITEAIEKGATSREIDGLIDEIDNPLEFERALRMLVQVGVFVPSKGTDEAKMGREERAASESATRLFSTLRPIYKDSDAEKPQPSLTGRREPRVSTVPSEFEEVAHNYTETEDPADANANRQPEFVDSKNPYPDSDGESSPATESGNVETVLLDGMETPSIMAERLKRAGGVFQLKPKIEAISKSISLAISTAISTIQELPKRGRQIRPIRNIRTVTFQMWIAIAITVLFGSLVITGLVLISSEGKKGGNGDKTEPAGQPRD